MDKVDRSRLGALLAVAAAMASSACATSGEDVATSAPVQPEPPRLCDAGPAQRHVGQRASEAIAATILGETGARTLRWGPPRSAWTMDYRQDRVNVRYDDAMTIIGITCG
jgi:hypothetical protein